MDLLMAFPVSGAVVAAIVDFEDCDVISSHCWAVDSMGYAASRKKRNHPRKLLHRLVANTPADMKTDHRNGDKLDNRCVVQNGVRGFGATAKRFCWGNSISKMTLVVHMIARQKSISESSQNLTFQCHSYPVLHVS